MCGAVKEQKPFGQISTMEGMAWKDLPGLNQCKNYLAKFTLHKTAFKRSV